MYYFELENTLILIISFLLKTLKCATAITVNIELVSQHNSRCT